MPDEGPLKTNFLDNQAREISKPALGKAPLRLIIAVIATGFLWGAYQAVLYIVNLPKSTAMRNVYVTLKNPSMMDGVARVDMTINNLNPTAISNIGIRYSILSPSGATVASDVVTVPDSVPAGDARTFPHVKLGAFSDQSARMHAELTEVTLGPKTSLTADQETRFTDDAAIAKDDERAQQFEQFVKEAPNFVPGHIELGRALMACNEYEKAIAVLTKATQLDPQDGNAHYRLAIALQHFGKREAAGKELRQALNLLNNDPDVQRTAQHFDPE